MSNTAEIFKFPTQEGKQESRMAELEKGYLRLANQIQDALCIVELSGREFRVLNAIVRLTYGWSKKSDRIANSLIADKTTLKVKHVSEAVLSLAYRNIIILRRIGQTRYIGINTNLDKWAYTKPNCTRCPVTFPAVEAVIWVISVPEVSLFNPQKQGWLSPKTGTAIPESGDGKNTPQTIPVFGDGYPRKQGKVSPETGNTKYILSKTKIKDLTPYSPPGGKVKFDPLSMPIPEWLNAESWNEWVAYRRQAGKPIKTEMTVTKAFNLLKECLDEGYDPVAVINASIANGYQGLFKPKFGTSSRQTVRDVNQISRPDTKIPTGFRGAE